MIVPLKLYLLEVDHQRSDFSLVRKNHSLDLEEILKVEKAWKWMNVLFVIIRAIGRKIVLG